MKKDERKKGERERGREGVRRMRLPGYGWIRESNGQAKTTHPRLPAPSGGTALKCAAASLRHRTGFLSPSQPSSKALPPALPLPCPVSVSAELQRNTFLLSLLSLCVAPFRLSFLPVHLPTDLSISRVSVCRM